MQSQWSFSGFVPTKGGDLHEGGAVGLDDDGKIDDGGIESSCSCYSAWIAYHF